MGSVISNYRNKHNKEIFDRLISKYQNTFRQMNIGVTFTIGTKLKTKTFFYKNGQYSKYYIIINLPMGVTSNYNIIHSGTIVLNGPETMAQLAFNKYQSISKIYKPLNEFYKICSINLENNSNLDEALINIIIQIASLQI
jgi:hypothetical protein